MSSIKIALPAQAAAAGAITTTIGATDTTDDIGTTVVACVLIPPAGFAQVTGVVTNNVTFTVRQLRAGAVVDATVAQITLAAGTNLVAETPLVMPFIQPQVPVQANDVFDVVMTQNGTGLAVGAGVLAQVEVN